MIAPQSSSNESSVFKLKLLTDELGEFCNEVFIDGVFCTEVFIEGVFSNEVFIDGEFETFSLSEETYIVNEKLKKKTS